MKKILFFLAISLFACVSIVSAQPRPAETPSATPAQRSAEVSSMEARYEGGMFGFNKKEKGMLKLDELNERLVFYGEDKKEKFAIPFASILVIYPNTNKVQSGTGRTIGSLPLPGAGIGGSFLKKKKNFMIVQFRDQDVDMQGSASFLIDTNPLLLSMVQTLGEKSKMIKRGDAYYRPKNAKAVEEF